MWYYLDKEKNKRGPIADAALGELYAKRAITLDTKVWQRGMKNWTTLGKTGVYKLFGRKSYAHLTMLSKSTRVFRGLLSAFTILILATLVMDFKRLRYFETLLSDNETTSDFLKCVGVEYHKITLITSLILFALLLLIAKAAYDWIYTVVSNLRSLDKSCRLSPSFSGWSLFIPIVNLVNPFVVMFYVYKASKNANGKAFSILDFNFLVLWWFFTLFELLILFFQKFWFSGLVNMDAAKSILIFGIYHTIILTIACCMWIILISRIFLLQRKIFYK
ncbi:MAG: DUF4339 domain-containing protein [Opitutales bacterium]|nr:DUF4339 domain-containing protein [Opitutales bacterium]